MSRTIKICAMSSSQGITREIEIDRRTVKRVTKAALIGVAIGLGYHYYAAQEVIPAFIAR